MNWKDKINELSLKGLVSYGTEDELKSFIYTEVIEKLINDELFDNFIQEETTRNEFKQQLKDKWQ